MSKNYYSLEVTTTQQCNLRCTYCFEGKELDNTSKALPVETIIDKVNEMLNSAEFLKHHDGITINFWGGEPTLNPAYCQSLIEAFQVKHVDFFFYTNGYSYSNIEKILNFASLKSIEPERIRMQISFDGIWNDDTRVLKNQSGTSDKVMETFGLLFENYPKIHVSLKSTLPVEKLVDSRNAVVENWKYFKVLVQNYGQRACYNPTLEYTNFYKLSEKQIDNMKHQFTKIARLELDYYEQNKSHIMSWFTVRQTQLCSAGMNIGNIDLEGNISLCHGALYSPKKNELVFGNIKQHNLADTVIKMKDIHFRALKDNNEVENECKGCVATVCYQCPTVNHQYSKQDEYIKKLHDPKKDLCSIYKTFGQISNVLFKYLNS